MEVLIFILALATRLVLFSINLDFNNGDFIQTIRGQDGYYEISKNPIEGNGFTFDKDLKPDPLRPPVWPYTMALIAWVFNSYIPVFIFEVIIASLIPILGMRLARRIITPKLSTIVGFLLAIEPYGVFLSILTITETPFTFLFLLSILFLFRYLEQQTARNIVWSGIFLGLAIMIKPTIQFFPVLVPIALYLWFRKSRPENFFKHLFAYVLISVAIIAPWVCRNYVVFNGFGLSAQPAFNLYFVLAPSVLSLENGTNFATEYEAFTSPDDEVTLTNSSEYIQKALTVFKEHKFAFIKSLGVSIVTFFTHDGMLTLMSYSGIGVPNLLDKPALVLLVTEPQELFSLILFYLRSPAVAILIVRLLWIAITALALFGVARYLFREKLTPFVLGATLIIAYFALLTTVNGLGMNARFRVPVNAFIFTFAVYGFVAIHAKIQAKLVTRHA